MDSIVLVRLCLIHQTLQLLFDKVVITIINELTKLVGIDFPPKPHQRHTHPP